MCFHNWGTDWGTTNKPSRESRVTVAACRGGPTGKFKLHREPLISPHRGKPLAPKWRTHLLKGYYDESFTWRWQFLLPLISRGSEATAARFTTAGGPIENSAEKLKIIPEHANRESTRNEENSRHKKELMCKQNKLGCNYSGSDSSFALPSPPPPLRIHGDAIISVTESHCQQKTRWI